MVTSGLQKVTWQFPKSGHSLYRGRKRVDWHRRPDGMVYKNKAFLRRFGPHKQVSHGDSGNHTWKTETILGRNRWLLCGSFREFKKHHKKIIEINKWGKILAIFAKGLISFLHKKITNSPGWCGSVDWGPVWGPRGCRFNSQSGTCLGCRPGLQLGACVTSNYFTPTQWFFSPSLSPSLPLSLKINK